MVVAGTDSGQPAASTALRPMLRDCSETCMTQPMITSSIRAGSRLFRSATALSASEARSTACQLRSFPLRFPPGVRTASTITAVVMVSPPKPGHGDRRHTGSDQPTLYLARPTGDLAASSGPLWDAQ